MRVLTFDIGIKHLAWCLYDLSENQIMGWDVQNLMEDQEVAVERCGKCKAKATYKSPTAVYCKRHCLLEPLLIKDTPTLLETLKTKEPTNKSKSKVKILEALGKYYSLPIVFKKVSASHAIDGQGIHKIHDAIREFLIKNHELFFQADKVLLENQPVYKNPSMKTVQILLYAEVRSMFLDHDLSPHIAFIHAGRKNIGIKGDAGYGDRKKQTKARAEAWFEKYPGQTKWSTFYKSHMKRDDLADTLCMCLDQA